MLDSTHGARSEGNGELAVFWRRALFRQLDSATWLVHGLLDEAENADVRAALDAGPEAFRAHARAQPHVALAVRLRCASSWREVVVVNLHLVMAGAAAHLRALQACLVLRRARSWMGPGASLLVCGDLNCRGGEPESESVLGLLTQGAVPASHHNFVLGRALGVRAEPCEEGGRCAAVHGGKRCEARAEAPGEAREPGPCRDDRLCWDHRCPCCGAVKKPRLTYNIRRQYDMILFVFVNIQFQDLEVNFEYPEIRLEACERCAVEARAVPPHGFDGLFSCRLTQPFGPLAAAYWRLTGEPALFTAPFHPQTGEDYPTGFAEMKDHILCWSPPGSEPHDLEPLWVLPPPPLETLRGMPSLSWPSDHVSVVADLRWA